MCSVPTTHDTVVQPLQLQRLKRLISTIKPISATNSVAIAFAYNNTAKLIHRDQMADGINNIKLIISRYRCAFQCTRECLVFSWYLAACLHCCSWLVSLLPFASWSLKDVWMITVGESRRLCSYQLWCKFNHFLLTL